MRRWSVEHRGNSVIITPHSGYTIRIVVLSDVHVPYHDPHALRLALRIAQWIKPQIAIILGDFVDFHGISRFPVHPLRRLLFRREIELAQDVLQSIRNALPDTYFYYLEGNHEARLRAYLWRKAQELSDLPGLQVGFLLQLERLGITYIERSLEPKNLEEYVAAQIRVTHLYMTHGDHVRTSGHTVNVARTVFLRTLVPMLIGHWHRVQHYEQTSYSGSTSGCWVTGCLCYQRPSYDAGRIWGQGIAVVTATKDQFRPELVSFFRQGQELHALVQGTHFRIGLREDPRVPALDYGTALGEVTTKEKEKQGAP